MRAIFTLLMFVIGSFAYTQEGVAINNNGSAPNASAILDLQSTNKGFLVPRMTQSQKVTVAAPSLGLLIYQTD